MMSEPQARRSLTQQITIIFLARTSLHTAHRIIYPFLPSLARGLGISLQAASGLVTLRMVAGMTAPVLGVAGDRYGRRRTMVAGLLLVAFASLLLAGAGTAGAAAVAFILYGLSKAAYDPAMQAYIGDTVPYARRGRAIGIIELSWSCAWLVGVPVSGFLIESLGWRAPWAGLMVLGLLGAWLTHTRLPPGRIAPAGSTSTPPLSEVLGSLLGTWRSLLHRRPATALLATSLCLSMAIEIPFIVYGAWLETEFGLSLTALGLASMAVGLAEATAELGTTVVTDRLGKRRSTLLGSLGLAASLALLPWLSQHGLPAAMAGVVLMLLSFEFAFVSLLPLATELAPDARASYLSLNITAQSLGRVIGAAVGGWLWLWQKQVLPGMGTITVHAVAGAGSALLAAIVLALGLSELRQR